MALLAEFQALVPPEAEVTLLGDGELLGSLDGQGWRYVCRTAKDTQVYTEGEWLELGEWAVPDRCFGWHADGFTQHAYGPVTVVVWWEKAHPHPLFLVSNLELVAEICSLYRRRMRIETLFSDQKSRGFALVKSHIADPARLFRVLMAAYLASIWLIYLGVHAQQHSLVPIIHRTDRCDLSLFQLGLDLLAHCLNEEMPIPVGFRLPRDFLFA